MITSKRVRRTDQEAALVADWLAKDETHQALGLTIDDVFAPNTLLDLISDEKGPLIAVRTHLALRAAMQFRPESRIRIVKAMPDVLKWLQQEAKDTDCTEIIGRPAPKVENLLGRLGCQSFTGQVLGV